MNQGDSVLPSARQRGSLPGWPIWVSLLIVALAVVAISLRMRDPSVTRAATTLGIAIAATTLWTWFTCRSRYSVGLRRTVFWGTLALLAALVGLLRIEKATGGFGFEFAWRWTPRHDLLLDASFAGQTQTTVDLATTSAEDFPQFLGPHRNSIVDSVRLDPDWETHPPQLVWKKEIGAGWSGFAVVNQAAITMEQRGPLELVTCYDTQSGDLNWSHVVETRHETTLGYIGPRSTPTIHEGRVYALGATGMMRCLNGLDGTEIWKRDLFQDYGLSVEEAERGVAWGRAASPLVVNDLVIVPVGKTGDERRVGLIAMDANDGSTRWEGGDYQAAYASPVYATLHDIPQVLIVNQDFVSAHDVETGQVLWDYPWPGKSNSNANVSQPVPVEDNHVFLSKGYGHGSELIHVLRHDDQWSVESIWQAATYMRTKFSNVAIRDGYAYGLDEGILNCLEVQTGKRGWKRGRFGYGQILMVQDKLLVLSERGHLVIVQARPDEYQELGRIQALHGQTWNTLCLAGSRLFIRNSEEAACYILAALP